MTQHWTANSIMDMIRNVFAFLDLVVYTLLGWMYQILFNVAGWDIFTSETVRGVYGRVQMILGVFMMFRLAITIIQGIINPDTFTDKKAGIGNIITRVIFALIMLTVLTPLNISGAGGNSFYTEVNNNGILFGTLYSLQDRILKNNVLGKLILGTNATEEAGDSQTSIANQGDEFTEMSNVFSSTILKSFIRINLKDPDDLGISADQLNENNASHRMCSNISSGTLNVYNKEDASPSQILGLINASCETEGGAFASILGGFKRLTGTDRYVFAYLPIISTLVGGILIYILVGEIITIAIRSLKLAVLRVIAPIPVISYIQPSKDNGMFGAWMKSLISTYLELFIHLAVIYFVLFLVQDLIMNGFEFPETGGMIGVFSFIFLVIGLFFFIKMAPRFIMNALGIKGGGGNIGMGALLSATGAGIAGGSLRQALKAANETAGAYAQAYNTGKPGPPVGHAFEAGRDSFVKDLTGDDKMTYKRFSQGRKYLASEGITSERADIIDDQAKAAKAFTERMADDAKAGRFSYIDSDGTTKNYQYTDNNGNTHNVTNADEMSLALTQQRAAAGKLESTNAKMSKELDRYGGGRSYKAKKTIESNATFFDSVKPRNISRTMRYFAEDVSEKVQNIPGDIGAKAQDAVNWHNENNRSANRTAHQFEAQNAKTARRNEERRQGRQWQEETNLNNQNNNNNNPPPPNNNPYGW